jgi:hypothetical protein
MTSRLYDKSTLCTRASLRGGAHDTVRSLRVLRAGRLSIARVFNPASSISVNCPTYIIQGVGDVKTPRLSPKSLSYGVLSYRRRALSCNALSAALRCEASAC